MPVIEIRINMTRSFFKVRMLVLTQKFFYQNFFAESNFLCIWGDNNMIYLSDGVKFFPRTSLVFGAVNLPAFLSINSIFIPLD